MQQVFVLYFWYIWCITLFLSHSFSIPSISILQLVHLSCNYPNIWFPLIFVYIYTIITQTYVPLITTLWLWILWLWIHFRSIIEYYPYCCDFILTCTLPFTDKPVHPMHIIPDHCKCKHSDILFMSMFLFNPEIWNYI